jgi:hypothetical protein
MVQVVPLVPAGLLSTLLPGCPHDCFFPKHLGRASLDDLAGRQASWTRYRYPAVFGPVVTHLVTHRSVMAHTSRVPS